MYISKKNGITSSSIQLLSNTTMVILPDKFYFEVTDIGTSFTVYVTVFFHQKIINIGLYFNLYICVEK